MSGTTETWVTDSPVSKADIRAIFEPYTLVAQYNGVIPDGIDILRMRVPIALEFAADLPLTVGVALVAPTANTDFTIKKNGSSCGTIRFEAGSPTSILITFASTVTFAVGDLLQITAPGTADATLADISITLVGKR